MGLLQLVLEAGKETLQQPGVLIGVPLEQQLAPLGGMVISLSYTIKCFPFSTLTIQLTYICACCTRSRSSAIVKPEHNTASFAWLLTTLRVRQENACLKIQKQEGRSASLQRTSAPLLSPGHYILNFQRRIQ